MKKNIKKVFVSILAATTVFTSTGPALAAKITVNMPYSIYENVEKHNISSGVVYEKIMRFTTSGWWNINVLRIDLLDPYTEIKGLFNPNGIPNRDKVSSLVEKHDAVAGINGDYFNYAPLPSSLGTLINDGTIISSPIEKDYALPTFFIDFLNNAKIDYLDRSMVATNLSSGKKVVINAINKVTTNFEVLTLLDKNWGTKSIGNKFHSDLVEVVVEDDVVTDVRIGKEAVNIPQNGYVLAVRGEERKQGVDQFAVGDPIDLKLATSPSTDEIKFAIGGGSIILKDGELSLTNINSQGNAPRTGIGISKDGKELILVTIDGRDKSFKGVSQEMFGAILRDLGAYNGLNLDGGGSTTMAIKPIDEQKATVVNKPSEGTERLVVNGVGVFSNAPVGELSYIKVSTDDSNMFLNTSRDFTVKGYDEYHNPVAIDKSKLIFTHEGVEGTIDGNNFKALSEGVAKISANYDGITASTEVKVLGPVRDLTTDLSNFNMDLNSERTLPVFNGKDKNGYQAKVYPKDIEFTTINNIGTVNNGVFHSGDKSQAGVLTAKLGDGVKNIIVTVGSSGKLVESFESINNIHFSPYPDAVKGSVSLSQDVKEGKSSLSLKYDFSGGTGTRAAYINFGTGDKKGLTIAGVPKKLGIWVKGDGSGTWLRGTLKDSKGKEHTIDFTKNIDFSDWRFVEATIPSNISYPIILERIYPVETDSLKAPAGELLLDGLTAFYPPTLGNVVMPTPSSLKDDKNVKSNVEDNGFTFAVAAEPKKLDELVKYDASSKIKARINKSKIAVFLNSVSKEFSNGLNNYARIDASSGYKKDKHKEVVFISVNTDKKGIRATNASQWNNLKNDLSKIQEDNIVLFFTTPIFGDNGFEDKLEADLLHSYLVEAHERGKNVFVVHGGSYNASDLKDGIRYISLNTKTPTKADEIYDLGIVEFVVNGKNMTYTISPLFEKPGVKVK